jgi:hypothetical protein
MYHHNFMWYFMTTSRRFCLWRKMRFHLIELSWLRTPARRSRRNIMSQWKHGFFQMPYRETFLCLNEIRMYLSLIAKQSITIFHKICLPLKYSLQFKLAFQFQMRWIKPKAPYCLRLIISQWRNDSFTRTRFFIGPLSHKFWDIMPMVISMDCCIKWSYSRQPSNHSLHQFYNGTQITTDHKI